MTSQRDVITTSHATEVIDWEEFWTRPPETAHWLHNDLKVIAAGRGHILYGPSGSGKSLFVLYLAARYALDGVLVVYLDYEMAHDDVRERLTSMGYGPGSDLALLKYCPFPTLPKFDSRAGGTALVKLVDDLRRESEAENALVILDTWSRIVDGPDNDTATPRAFETHTASWLKREGIGWLVIDHVGHDTSRQRGSTGKSDLPDIRWAYKATSQGVELTRSKGRQTWVPEKLVFRRTLAPLAFHPAIESAPSPEALEVAAELNALDVPVDTTVDAANAALKAAAADGHGRKRELVGQAVRWRKQGGTLGTVPGTANSAASGTDAGTVGTAAHTPFTYGAEPLRELSGTDPQAVRELRGLSIKETPVPKPVSIVENRRLER